MALDDKLIEKLNKEIAKLNKNMSGGGTRGAYNTTRFTTPDVGGFRAFFSTAIGDPLIEAISEKGIGGALKDAMDKLTGVTARENIRTTSQTMLNKLEELPAFKQMSEGEQEEHRAYILEKAQNQQTAETIKNLRSITGALGVATFALIKFRDSIIQAGQQLGGVSLDQALENRMSSFFTSIRSLFSGDYVRGSQIEAIQGSVSGEFGTLINTEEALRLGRMQQRLGLATGELTKLQRALQGTGMDAENTINEFRRVGIVGRVAATELSKNADAVARAGSRFNEFIVDGIANAKRLGLEFGQIEQTLTGISTNFTGTVSSFSELRAVLPGFSTDFGQLFSTALYGSTDEFVEQIRSGLMGAGISDVSQMNRAQIALLEQATGFGAAEIQRILNNEEVFQDETMALDTKRNSLLNQGNILLAGVGGAIVGAIIGAHIPILGKLGIGAVVGAATGGGIGAGLGYGAGRMFNDFVFRPGQPPARFSPNDTLIGVKNPSMLGKTEVVNDYSNLEQKMDQLILVTREQVQVMQNGMSLEVRGMDKAIARKRDAIIRDL